MAHKGEKSNGSHYDSSGATKNVYSKKKRTSFVNENDWWEKLSYGLKSLKKHYSQPWPPANEPKFNDGTSRRYREQKKREGLSNLPSYTMPKADPRKFEFSKEELSGNAMKDPWNARKKQKSDNASRY